MTGAVRQIASSARPSITTGSDVRTATALEAVASSAAAAVALLWSMQAIANRRANEGMGVAPITVERLDRFPCPKVGSEEAGWRRCRVARSRRLYSSPGREHFL